MQRFVFVFALLLAGAPAQAMKWGTFRTSTNIIDRRLCTDDVNNPTKNLPGRAVSYQDAVCRMSESGAHVSSVWSDLAQQNCADSNPVFGLYHQWLQSDGGKLKTEDPLLILPHESVVDGPNDLAELQQKITQTDACSGAFSATRRTLTDKLSRVKQAHMILISNYEKHARAAALVAKKAAGYTYAGCEIKKDKERWYASGDATAANGKSGGTGKMNIVYWAYAVSGADEFKDAYADADKFLVKKINFLNNALSRIEFASGGGQRCGTLR